MKRPHQMVSRTVIYQRWTQTAELISLHHERPRIEHEVWDDLENTSDTRKTTAQISKARRNTTHASPVFCTAKTLQYMSVSSDLDQIIGRTFTHQC